MKDATDDEIFNRVNVCSPFTKTTSIVTYLEENENSLEALLSESTPNPPHMTCQKENREGCSRMFFSLKRL